MRLCLEAGGPCFFSEFEQVNDAWLTACDLCGHLELDARLPELEKIHNDEPLDQYHAKGVTCKRDSDRSWR